jgi:PadR family transcriptional regulator PadR
MAGLISRIEVQTKGGDINHLPVATLPIERRSYGRTTNRRNGVLESKSDVLQGTLDLMVLKTLESMGPLHGYGIARRIEQVSENTVVLNQGTIYPALLRLEQRAWVKAEWGTSETGRRARFYSLTRSGRK